MTQSCEYQKRYTEHQERKKSVLSKEAKETDSKIISDFQEVVNSRRSVRVFLDKQIENEKLTALLEAVLKSPSSCNRQAICVKIVKEESYKNYLSQVLVGGKGWIEKADKIILLFADMDAYKSPNEVLYMPYLDAGVIMMAFSLSATSLGLASCIVNPNIRQNDRNGFNSLFNQEGYSFCGAIALGYQGITPPAPPKKSINEFIICELE